MSHTALSGKFVGMAPHGFCRPAEDGDFQAVIVAEMHVRGGYAEIVTLMLGGHQALWQVTKTAAVDICERRHAGSRSVRQMLMLSRLTQHLPDCLRAAGIATCRNQGVNFRQQIVVDRDGDAFHAWSLRRIPVRSKGMIKRYLHHTGLPVWMNAQAAGGRFRMLSALRQRMAGGTGRRVVGIYVFLGLANILPWLVAVAVFHNYPLLLGTSLLAYSFGLRHAVDADHIAAIDNVTRKLMQQGQRPAGVGFFFSLGHSTIVFGLSAAVAITTVAIKERFDALENWGNVVGTLISAFFLFAIAVMNLLILATIIATFRRVRAGGRYSEEDLNILLARRGFFGRIFRGLFKLVDHSWQMYFVGLLFGLGFDTATEVGVLGISAAAASKGLPIWSIMVFPALFTAGMALIDTTDSILMLGAYGWAFMKPVRKLYYNITITSVSVAVAVVIGGLETLGLIQGKYNLTGWFWDPIASLNGDTAFGVLGYTIVGIFILAWIVSVSIYKLKRYDEIEFKLSD